MTMAGICGTHISKARCGAPGGEVGEVVGELGEVAVDVAGSDAGAEETLAELAEVELGGGLGRERAGGGRVGELGGGEGAF